MVTAKLICVFVFTYAKCWFSHDAAHFSFRKESGIHGVQDDFSGQLFRIFDIIIFCFVVAICDLVHAVEAMHGLP